MAMQNMQTVRNMQNIVEGQPQDDSEEKDIIIKFQFVRLYISF